MSVAPKAEIQIIINDAACFQDLSVMLIKHGYIVQHATDVDSASTMLDKALPDLILIDTDSIGQSGYTFSTNVRADSRTQAIPILFLYAMEELVDRGQGFAAGGSDYLIKPLEVQEVVDRITTHLSARDLQGKIVEREDNLQHETAMRQQAEADLERVNEELAQQDVQHIAALRASEAMFRYFLARAHDGYLIVDEQDRIVYANAQARLYLGLGDETGPEPLRSFMVIARRVYHCEPEIAWRVWPKKTFIEGSVVPLYLVRPETPSSSTFWLRVTMLDVPAGMDEQSGRIIRMTDVTSETVVQEELNKFHSIISHKLRTPLVPVYSGLRFLVDNMTTLTREDIASFLGDALLGVDRLHDQIEDIVRYLRTPSRAGHQYGMKVAAIPPLVKQINTDLKLENVELVIEEELDDAQLLLSEQSFELILWELLENSQKFHPQQSPNVTIRLLRSGLYEVSLKVYDDGVNLSPDQLTQMWTPYYQVDRYMTGQIAGMGLGLSFVATQVWSVGGTCWAFNRQDGPGIVVELILPLAT